MYLKWNVSFEFLYGCYPKLFSFEEEFSEVLSYTDLSLHVVPVIFDINHNLTISWQILAESPITKFHENLYMEGKLLLAHRHDKANTNFLQLYKCTLQTKPKVTILQANTYVG